MCFPKSLSELENLEMVGPSLTPVFFLLSGGIGSTCFTLRTIEVGSSLIGLGNRGELALDEITGSFLRACDLKFFVACKDMLNFCIVLWFLPCFNSETFSSLFELSPVLIFLVEFDGLRPYTDEDYSDCLPTVICDCCYLLTMRG